MKYSLKTKLSLSYLLNSLIIILIITICSNIILNKKFDEYIIEQQNKKNDETYNTIVDSYNEYKSWNLNSLNTIGMNALENGLIIKLNDSNNEVVWDATIHNSGMCVSMLKSMQENMESRYKNFDGEYTEKQYPIMYEQEIVGYLYIGYYGPFYLNDNDLYFIETLNNMLVIISLISIAISFIVGMLMAKRINDPILEVINIAKKIEKGNYKYKIKKHSKTLEINEMINTINSLADVLESQENLRNRLTSDIAHELRTPITIVKTHLEAMIDGVWDITKERLESCNMELKRITSIVEDLEKLAEIENIKLNKVDFNIDELILSISKSFEIELTNKNISLKENLNSKTIFADKDRIGQVIVNILSNAIKYTSENGKIEISTKIIGNNTILIIKDNGIGISEEDLPHIFDRFYRADKSRNRNTGGSGIGLSIVKSIIEAHNAKVIVNSEINKGSEFIITI